MGLNIGVLSLYPELAKNGMEVPLLVNLWVNVVRTLFSAALESFSFVLASTVHGMEVPLPVKCWAKCGEKPFSAIFSRSSRSTKKMCFWSRQEHIAQPYMHDLSLHLSLKKHYVRFDRRWQPRYSKETQLYIAWQSCMHHWSLQPTSTKVCRHRSAAYFQIPSDSYMRKGKKTWQGEGFDFTSAEQFAFFPLERTKLSAQLFISKFIAV